MNNLYDRNDPIFPLQEKFNKFVKDQVTKSSEKINYSITVEDGTFEIILEAIKNTPLKPFPQRLE